MDTNSGSPSSDGTRWAPITPDDHSGVVYIAAFLNLTYSSITFAARYFLRRRTLGWDDAAMFVAQIATLVQFSLLLVSLSAGLAKSTSLLSKNEYTRMTETRFGTQIATYTALCFSKLSTIFLTRQLFASEPRYSKERITCNVSACAVLLWLAAAATLVSTGCARSVIATNIDSHDDTCPQAARRYKTISIVDATTEVLLVVMPVYFCWRVLLSWSVRLQVLAVFSFRVPVAVITLVYLREWLRVVVRVRCDDSGGGGAGGAANPGVDATVLLALQQCHIFASLMAGTIPCLKTFIRSFDTGSGVKATTGTTTATVMATVSLSRNQNSGNTLMLQESRVD